MGRHQILGRPIFLLVGAVVAGAVLAAACSKSTPTAPTPTPDPLKLTCPAPVTQTSQSGQPTPIIYTPATAEGGTRPVQITCTPESNASFAVGTTATGPLESGPRLSKSRRQPRQYRKAPARALPHCGQNSFTRSPCEGGAVRGACQAWPARCQSRNPPCEPDPGTKSWRARSERPCMSNCVLVVQLASMQSLGRRVR